MLLPSSNNELIHPSLRLSHHNLLQDRHHLFCYLYIIISQYIRKILVILAGEDIYRLSFRPGSCSPPYPVDILLALAGNVVIVNMGNAVDIEPPCSNISAYKDTGFPGMEHLHNIVPPALG